MRLSTHSTDAAQGIPSHSLVFRATRWALRHAWALLVGYCGIVIQNIAHLIYHNGIVSLLNTSLTIQALLFRPTSFLPEPLVPTVVYLIVTFVLVFLGLFAQASYEHDRSLARQEQQRHRNGALNNLANTKLETLAIRTALQRELQPQIESLANQPTTPTDKGQHLHFPPFDVDDHVLPQPEHLFGRNEELSWLLERLKSHASPDVTALYGAGGVGKTALVAVAVRQLLQDHYFLDGIVVIHCEDLTSSLEVMRQIVARFDSHGPQLGKSDLKTLLNRARTLLDEKDVLIILDNIEQGLPIRQLVRALHTIGVTTLITARQEESKSMLLPEAYRYLDVLSPNDALSLLAESLKIGSPPRFSAEERPIAEQIVAEVGNLALAIRLLAANALVQNQSLDALLNEVKIAKKSSNLGDRITASSPTTGRGIRLAFDVVERILSENEKRLFDALAAFATEEFGHRAAVSLAESLHIDKPEDCLDTLVTCALLKSSVNDNMPITSDRKRLIMHSMLRPYALEGLDVWLPSKKYAAYQAVARYFALLLSEVVSDDVIEADQRNIEGALTWAHAHSEHEIVADICWGMCGFWEGRWRTSHSLKYLPWGINAAKLLAERTKSTNDRTRTSDLEIAYAQILRRVGQLDKAEQVFRHNINISHDLQTQDREASIYYQLGQVARGRGELEDAKEHFEKSLRLQREIGNKRGEGANLRYLGRIAQERGLLDNAEEYFHQSLAMAQSIGDRHGEGLVRSLMGVLELTRKRLDEADIELHESLAIHKEIGDSQSEAADLTQLGRLELARGQFDKAEEYLLQSLHKRREIQDHRGESLVLTALGQVALGRGERPLAIQYFEESLVIARRVKDRRTEGVNLSLLGLIAFENTRLEAAEQYYTQALAIAQDVQNFRGAGNDYFALGRIARKRDQSTQAEQWFLQALRTAREIKYTELETLAYYALGQLAREQDRLDDANLYYQGALICDRNAQDRQGESTDLTLLGQIAHIREDYAIAQQYYEQALKIQREVGDTQGQSVVLNGLGEVAKRRGARSEAESYYKEALDVDKARNDLLNEGMDLVALGQLAYETGRLAEARQFYHEALIIHRASRHIVETAITSSKLAILNEKDGQPNSALRDWLNACVGFELAQSSRASVALQGLSNLRLSLGERKFQAVLSEMMDSEPERAYNLRLRTWQEMLRKIALEVRILTDALA